MEYMDDLLKVEVRDHATLMTINHPPPSILAPELSVQTRDTLYRLKEDNTTRVVVPRGSGEKALCVGASIKKFLQVWGDMTGKKLMNENLVIGAIEFLDESVTAAMEGNTLDGGCEITMTTDIRIMSQEGRIGLPEINLGVFPRSGGPFRFARYTGIIKTCEVLYTRTILDAREALQCGLVNRVVPRGQTEMTAMEMARIIVDRPFKATKLIKKGVRQLWQKTTEENFYPDLEFSGMVSEMPDCAEGVDTLIHKRQPRSNK